MTKDNLITETTTTTDAKPLLADSLRAMETKKVINLVKIFEKTPVELVLTKYLIINGVDTEEKLVELLKNEKTISGPMKVKIQNYFRDLVFSKIIDIDKVPNVFK